MEGFDLDRWKRHCNEVRQQNAVQAKALDQSYHAQVAGFLFFLLAPIAFLFSMLGGVTPGQAIDVVAPAPRVSEERVEASPPAFAEVEAKHSEALKEEGASLAPEEKASSSEITITVREGDTLWALVGSNWPQVCEVNNLANCDLIYPGQNLRIPVHRNERHEE